MPLVSSTLTPHHDESQHREEEEMDDSQTPRPVGDDLLQRLWGLYESHDKDMLVECWQECPHTAVKILLRHIDYPAMQAFGFATMRLTWDAEAGKNLAVHRALMKIAKEISPSEHIEITPEQVAG